MQPLWLRPNSSATAPQQPSTVARSDRKFNTQHPPLAIPARLLKVRASGVSRGPPTDYWLLLSELSAEGREQEQTLKVTAVEAKKAKSKL